MEAVNEPLRLMDIERELSGPGRDAALAKYDAVLAALSARVDAAMKEGLPPAEFPRAKALADGRVFSAEDALKSKLIDGIGHEADAVKQMKKLAGGDVRIYDYRAKNDFRSLLENMFIFESAGGLLGKMKAALVEETAPRAEYRVQ